MDRRNFLKRGGAFGVGVLGVAFIGSRIFAGQMRHKKENCVITMVSKDLDFVFFTMDGIPGKQVVIDWGDGTIETKTLSSFVSVRHIYNDEKTHTVTVTSENTITHFSCSMNQLTYLDVSGNTELIQLHCSFNYLTNLNLRNNLKLNYLQVFHNHLSSLDVSNNIELKELRCENNQLTSLDVSNNTALTRLSCYNNQFRTLDVSKNKALENLQSKNQFKIIK